MDALMGDLPLTLDLLSRRAERLFPTKQVVTATAGGPRRTPYGEWAERVHRVPAVLDALDVPVGGRVASLCWSTQEHLELYFGVPGASRVLHTLNPRFTTEQLRFVADEAEDRVIVVHASLSARLAGLLDGLPKLRHVVVIDDLGATPELEVPDGVQVHDYEVLLAAAAPRAMTVTDERQAAVLCHTGGTTGDPKGVLYSHRSLVLHAMATMSAGAMGIHERDVVMPVVPLFHANAVGFAHAAVGTGAQLVLPGSDLSGPTLAALLESERVSVTCGVPTIWTAVLPHLAAHEFPDLRLIISGASAVPPSLSERYRDAIGLPLTQIWGMTETSPLGTIVSVVSDLADSPDDVRSELRSTVGLPVLGVEARIADDDGAEVAWDGSTSGELQVRGPWVASGYFGGRSPESFTSDGWLRTGDIVTGDGHGYVRVVDRAKDVIKSGGEWISSIALENHLMAHPAVAEAAVVGVVDEKWGERPVAFVVPVDGPTPAVEDLAAHLADRVPSWWVPERFEFIDEVPKTSVGKFSKATLRARLDG
jgi:fatty-acyl-CoA synthase